MFNSKPAAAMGTMPRHTGASLRPLALAVASCLSVNAALAQDQKPATPSSDGALPTVKVTAKAEEKNTLKASSGVARIEGEIKDIPQVVNVVPQEVMQQQQVTTLEQALRNVPGITVAIGEANGGANGDQFRIRGASNRNDAYLDGLRDFGVYVRDTFNTEQVEVLKGPSSENFGMGSNGGAINSQTKRARLGNDTSLDALFGNGSMNRQTVDVNRQLGDTTAVRVNAMRQDQNVVKRDGVKSDRWGVAASFGMGIGTDTSWYLNYAHQSNDRTPDYGQPLIARTSSEVRRPIATYGIDRSNYYGKNTDRDRSDADILTSLFRRALNDKTTLSNETRVGYYTRKFNTTTPTCDQACADNYFNTGDASYIMSSGGGPRYAQRTWGAQNVTTLATAFDTGSLKHDARFGLDIAHQDDHRQAYAIMKPDMSGTATKLPGTLLHPDNSSNNYVIAINPAGTNDVRDSKMTDIALFASDRMHFTPEWSLLGSLRWDYYKQSAKLSTASTGAVSGDVDTKSTFISPRLSLMWEPSKDQSYYLAYGWASSTPWAGSITGDANPLGVNNSTPAGEALRSLDPEKTKTLELGGKVNLLGGRLGLTGAIFRTEKNNTYYDNGTNVVPTGNKERYTGVELGINGEITRDWTAYVGYTFIDSEITDASNKANIGNPVQGVARNAATLWTSYNLTSALTGSLPGKLTIGGGVTYRDSMYTRDDKMAKVPYSLSVDAMVAYQYRNYRVSLNGYNLTNRLNYDNWFAGENANTARAIPAPGRAFVLGIGVSL